MAPRQHAGARMHEATQALPSSDRDSFDIASARVRQGVTFADAEAVLGAEQLVLGRARAGGDRIDVRFHGTPEGAFDVGAVYLE